MTANPFSVDGLIAHYSFEGNADDMSGNGHHGIQSGAPDYISNGVNGQSLSLDGIDDIIFIPNDFLTHNYSISVWLKENDQGNLRGMRFVDGWTGGEIFGIGYREFYGQNWHSASCIGYEGPEKYLIADYHPWATETRIFEERHLFHQIDLHDGLWHNIVSSFDGSNAKLYLDGEMVNEFTFYLNSHRNYPVPPWKKSNYHQTVQPAIGASIRNGDYCEGYIDEVSFFNGALSDEEVMQLYSATQAVPEPGVFILFLSGLFFLIKIKKKEN